MNSFKETMNAQPQSPLMRLPTELRLMIYELLLLSVRIIVDPHELLDRNVPQTWRVVKDVTPSLLRTCWIIYLEATPVLYSNVMKFSDPRHILRFNDELTTFTEVELENFGFRRTKRITNARLDFDLGGPFSWRTGRPNAADRASCAKKWTSQANGIFDILSAAALTKRKSSPVPSSVAAGLFPHILFLELDFSSWHLPVTGRVPAVLVRGLKYSGLKVVILKIIGLEHHLVTKEILEQALLKTPPPRKLTDAHDKRLRLPAP